MSRGFTAVHPFVLLIYYLLTITLIMSYKEIIFLTIVGCTIIICNLLLDRAMQLKKWSKALFGMGIVIIVLTPIFNHMGTTILFYLFKWPITLEALLYGVVLALTLVNIISLFIVFNLTLTNDKLLFLFGKGFPKWALLIMLSLRFVPLLKNRLQEISEVQQFKNGTEGKQSFTQKIKSGMTQIQILLSWSLEESIQTADSMDARGYGLGKRSMYHRYEMNAQDVIFLSYLCIVSVLFILSIYYPTIQSIALQGFFLTLFLTPLAIEGKEVVKWLFYRSKM